MNKNSLLYWFPKVKNLVPVPETVWVEIPENTWVVEWLDGGIPREFINKLKEKARGIGYPLFMRTDQFSGKHDYRDTCYVKSEDNLARNLFRLIEANECADVVGLPVNAIVLREFIELDWRFHAFSGLPIATEVRYFIRNNDVQCWHFYWPEDAIKFVEEDIDWRSELRDMMAEAKTDEHIHMRYAKKIARNVDGYWSVDFARAKNGKWYLIDMAIGEESYHQSECKYLSDEERERMLIYEGKKKWVEE